MLGLPEGKDWGTTQCIFKNDSVEVHRIFAFKGGYCSEHVHSSKFNQFYVESGSLEVSIFSNNNQQSMHSAKSTVNHGMSLVVKPGVKHKFEAMEDTIAFEIYWTEIDSFDITRYKSGGIVNDP